MSIGHSLTEARERAGLSLDEVAEATRIRRTVVRDIEADNFASCGGDFYARGHIRTIAATVGTDPAPLLHAFDRTHEPATLIRASEVFESETGAPPERRGPNWSAAMVVALVLVLAYGVVQVVTGSDHAGEVGGKAAPSGTASSGSTPTPSSSPSGNPSSRRASPPAPVAADRVTVTVVARSRSWISATGARRGALFSGLLRAGQMQTFTDRTRVDLVVGDAAAVSLTVNGEPVGAPGTAGQVARLSYDRDGAVARLP